MGATQDGRPRINSPEWWEEYFRGPWDENHGGEQTRHFMQRLLAELPATETAWLRDHDVTIADWGCAFGEGVDEIAAAFPRARVWGVDVAATAIAEAHRRFPDREFVHAADGAIARRADVIVSSNCLEHFTEPVAVAERLSGLADQLL